ncbi:MAG: hypothetical protein Q7W13_02575 [Bacteroidia bacterium]|nr:hypothetical protein [Bacteroidia bacterium]
MPKKRNLNGLAHNLTKSLFGTERYFKIGYMGDWLSNAARQLNLAEATIDILNASIDPPELNIYPLIINIKELKQIIEKVLIGNGFPLDFIVEAKIRMQFLNRKTHSSSIHCFPYLIDKDGHKYESGEIIEEVYETHFDPFDKAFH